MPRTGQRPRTTVPLAAAEVRQATISTAVARARANGSSQPCPPRTADETSSTMIWYAFAAGICNRWVSRPSDSSSSLASPFSVYGRPGSRVAGHLHMFTKRALTEFLTARGFACERVDGAPYHDVPAVLRPVDRLMCQWPSAASILLVQARRA